MMAEPAAVFPVRYNMPQAWKLIFGVSLATLLSPASGAQIHKWVDEKGVTHYSDEAPAVEPASVTLIEVPERSNANRPTPANYYSIANQWKRMHRERIERDRLALEKQRHDASQSPPSREVVYVEKPDETSYIGTYSGLRYLRHGLYRPHHGKGRHYRHGSRKRMRGHQRSGMRAKRTRLGYYKHIQ